MTDEVPIVRESRKGDGGRGPQRGATEWARCLGVLVALLACLFVFGRSQQGPLSAQERSYVMAVTLGAEHGDASSLVRKWTSGIRVSIQGDPQESDRAQVLAVITELSELLAPLPISLSEEKPNFFVHFVPEIEMTRVLPQYRPGNEGYCWIEWNDLGQIQRATVAISRDNHHEALRHHLIREEITQGFGVLRDSCREPDSIFYCRYSETDSYSALDRLVLRALYDPGVPTHATASTLQASLLALDW